MDCTRTWPSPSPAYRHFRKSGKPTCGIKPSNDAVATILFTIFADAIERLTHALQGIDVGRLGSARRRAGDHHLVALAQGLDQFAFVAGVLHPGTVVLRV